MFTFFQSTKNSLSALASLLPQTTIFPAPAPLAHQHHSQKLRDSPIRQDPPRVLQPPSVYSSQSRHVYGKPTEATPTYSKNRAEKEKDAAQKSSSPEIEILDLR